MKNDKLSEILQEFALTPASRAHLAVGDTFIEGDEVLTVTARKHEQGLGCSPSILSVATDDGNIKKYDCDRIYPPDVVIRVRRR
jgi:hypothetical protein